MNKGVGADAQGDASNSTPINGLNTVSLTSTGNPYNLLTNAAASYKSSMFIVMRGTTNSLGTYIFIYNNTSNNGVGAPDFFVKDGYMGTVQQNEIDYSFAGTTSVQNSSFMVPTLFSYVVNSDSVTSPDGAWWNGTNVSNVTANNGGTTSTAYNNASIGIGRNNSDDYDLGEIIVFQQELSVSDRQKIEGYLAWKWGLQANLPSAHPYKSSAPAVTGSAPTLSNLTVANITPYGCDVSWSSGSGATSYIYTINGIVCTPSTDNALSSSSISFNNLIENMTYTLVIKAINNHGTSISSTSLTMPTATEAPTAPENLSSSNITTTGFTVSWTGAIGVNMYIYSIDGTQVFADLDSSTPIPKREASFTGTIWLPSGGTMTLSSGTSYDVIVTASNSIGLTSSATLTVTTL